MPPAAFLVAARGSRFVCIALVDLHGAPLLQLRLVLAPARERPIAPVLVIIGVLLTTWMALRTKTTAAAIIFTLLIFVLGPTITSITKTIIEALVLLDIDQFSNLEAFEQAQAQINAGFEWVYFYQLQRLANLGSFFDSFGPMGINFLDVDTQPFILKILGSNVVLLFLLIVVGGKRFAQSDLR
jgi:hypothetical protein